MANINKGIPNIWFSGDKHLFHEFMVRGKWHCSGCNRPLKPSERNELSSCCHAPVAKTEDPPRPGFATVWDMNKVIINNHNEVVEKGDLVYEVGDFAVKCSAKEAREARYAMKGNFYFVRGNHDDAAESIPDAWIWMKDLYRFKPKGFGDIPHIVLCHYAMRVWHGSHKGAWQLFAHSHNQLPEDPKCQHCRYEDRWLSFDVGVDARNFYPISIQQVIDKMATRIPRWEAWKKRHGKPGEVGD
jgi:calcineurin-like phosphoesterase family protein